jgi:hypothetical protein
MPYATQATPTLLMDKSFSDEGVVCLHHRARFMYVLQIEVILKRNIDRVPLVMLT